MKQFLLALVMALSLVYGQAGAQAHTDPTTISEADAELNILYTPEGAKSYVNGFFQG